MSLRQHTPLVLTSADGTSHRLAPVSLQLGRTGGGYDEAWIRDLVFAHPAALPISEIEPSFGPLIPVCTELDTRTAGFSTRTSSPKRSDHLGAYSGDLVTQECHTEPKRLDVLATTVVFLT